MGQLYHGYRDHRGVAHVDVDGRPLKLRLDLDNHSPNGFEWGYGGSGPAQLALAMLADALGNDRLAQKLHQQFKFAVIAQLPQQDAWTLDAGTVRATAERLRLTYLEV